MLEIDIQQQLGDFSLALKTTIPNTGITAIFGPSGSGKSSLLNAIAGFTAPSNRSAISFNGEPWFRGSKYNNASSPKASNKKLNKPIHQRRIAYVTQSACLFEHLTILQNLNYAIKRARQRDDRANQLRRPQDRRVNRPPDCDKLCDSLNITKLLHKHPQELSGGEQQRVAIARALLSNPDLILFDEPLSALDEQSRENVLTHLEQLHHSLAIPFIYITHNFDELIRLADRVVLMDDGRLVVNQALASVLADLNLPLSGLHNAGVVIESCAVHYDKEHYLTQLLLGDSAKLWVNGQPSDHAGQAINQRNGHAMRVRVYARDVSIALSAASDSSILNIIPAVIEEISAVNNGQVIIRLNCDRHALLSRITVKSLEQLQLNKGQQVYAQIKGIALLGASAGSSEH